MAFRKFSQHHQPPSTDSTREFYTVTIKTTSQTRSYQDATRQTNSRTIPVHFLREKRVQSSTLPHPTYANPPRPRFTRDSQHYEPSGSEYHSECSARRGRPFTNSRYRANHGNGRATRLWCRIIGRGRGGGLPSESSDPWSYI